MSAARYFYNDRAAELFAQWLNSLGAQATLQDEGCGSARVQVASLPAVIRTGRLLDPTVPERTLTRDADLQVTVNRLFDLWELDATLEFAHRDRLFEELTEADNRVFHGLTYSRSYECPVAAPAPRAPLGDASCERTLRHGTAWAGKDENYVEAQGEDGPFTRRVEFASVQFETKRGGLYAAAREFATTEEAVAFAQALPHDLDPQQAEGWVWIRNVYGSRAYQEEGDELRALEAERRYDRGDRTAFQNL